MFSYYCVSVPAQLSATETRDIAGGFTDSHKLFGSGLRVAGEKYTVLRANDEVRASCRMSVSVCSTWTICVPCLQPLRPMLPEKESTFVCACLMHMPVTPLIVANYVCAHSEICTHTPSCVHVREAYPWEEGRSGSYLLSEQSGDCCCHVFQRNEARYGTAYACASFRRCRAPLEFSRRGW